MAEVRVWRNARGVWCCRPYLGTSAATGRAIRPYRQFPEAASEAEALELAEAWVAPLRSGELSSALMAYVDDVGAMGARKGHGSRANTTRNYRLMARRIGQILAGRAAAEVSAADVTRAYRLLMDPSGPWRLSARTVEGYHWFLCGAFRWMVEQGLCPSSPMAGVAHPSGAAAGRPSPPPWGPISRRPSSFGTPKKETSKTGTFVLYTFILYDAKPERTRPCKPKGRKTSTQFIRTEWSFPQKPREIGAKFYCYQSAILRLKTIR